MTHAQKWISVITMRTERTGSGPSLELNLKTLPAPDVAATVRSLLGLRLPLWNVADSTADDIMLVATELVANACEATPSAEIAFRARLDTDNVWIGVWDSSPAMPRPQVRELALADIDAAADDQFGGWGLALVTAVAAERGIQRTPGGKWVFAAFHIRQSR